jgi:hypothetical protein
MRQRHDVKVAIKIEGRGYGAQSLSSERPPRHGRGTYIVLPARQLRALHSLQTL